MKRPGLPLSARTLVVVVWALTAILASTVTSWAVSVVGSEEGAPRARVLTAADVTMALGQQSTAPTASPSSSAPAAPTWTPEASSPTPSATPKPTHKPTATPTPAAGPGTATNVTRILTVTGGRIEASCTGSVFLFGQGQPLDGWSISIGHQGSDGSEVTFRRDGSESHLLATCQAGIPTLDSAGGGD